MKLLVLLAVVGLSAAQITLDGQCDPTVPVEPNFDVPRYTGLWYEIYRYEALQQLGGDCVTANYTIINGTVNVVNRMVLLGRGISISGTAEVAPDANGGGKLIVDFPSTGGTSPYWVLTTDYDDFALVYVCANASNNRRRVFSWILSRTQTLTPRAVLQMEKRINDTDGLSWEAYRQTKQTETACRVSNEIFL